jgi:D-3-phosphoglycerate dehydrogenase
MDEVLAQSDVLSLHLPFTKETGTIIGAEQLALMKPDSLLINTARGALIDHEALLNALNKQRISGFAADVLPEEPPVPGFPILHHSRALVTPHSGSLTASTYRQMCVLTVKNVVAVLTDEKADAKSIFNFSALNDRV